MLNRNLIFFFSCVSEARRPSVLGPDLGSRLRAALESLIDATGRDPTTHRDCKEAVRLFAGVKDVLIPDCGEQFSIVADAVRAHQSSTGLSTGRWEFVLRLMDELDSANMLDMLQFASGGGLFDSLLSILDEMLRSRLQSVVSGGSSAAPGAASDSNSVAEIFSHQDKISKTFEKVVVLTIGNISQAMSKSNDAEFIDDQVKHLMAIVLRLLSSLRDHLGIVNFTVHGSDLHIAATQILESSHAATVAPVAVFLLHVALRDLSSANRIVHSTVLDLSRLLTEFGASFASTPSSNSPRDSSGSSGTCGTSTAAAAAAVSPRSLRRTLSSRAGSTTATAPPAATVSARLDSTMRTARVNLNEGSLVAICHAEGNGSSDEDDSDEEDEEVINYVYGEVLFDLGAGTAVTNNGAAASNYFEVEIVESDDCDIAVGVASPTAMEIDSQLPGCTPQSFAYHGDDGCYYDGNAEDNPVVSDWPSWAEGDVIGCGIDFARKSIFFTRNGVFLGSPSEQVLDPPQLKPVIGFGPMSNQTIRINFGNSPFRYVGPEVVSAPVGGGSSDNSTTRDARNYERAVIDIEEITWLELVNSEIISLRLLANKILVSPNSIDARARCEPAMVVKVEKWLKSPLFSRGLGLSQPPHAPTPTSTPEDAAIQTRAKELLKRLSTTALDDVECLKLISLMQKKVLEDRRGAKPLINAAVYAVCAAAIWHHGMANEALALAESRREQPSAGFITVWRDCQKLRFVFPVESDSALGSLGRVAEAGLGGADDEDVSVREELSLGTLAETISERARLLLQCQPVHKDTVLGNTRKKLWLAVAKLAAVQAPVSGNSPSSGSGSFQKVADRAATQKWLHDAIKYRADIARQSKDKKVLSLVETIVQFVQRGPPTAALVATIAVREEAASARSSGFEGFARLVSDVASMGDKARIFAALFDALHESSDVHYAAGLQGCSSTVMQLVQGTWKALVHQLILDSREWLQTCDFSSKNKNPTLNGLVCALSVVIQDFRVSDVELLRDVGLIGLLASTIQSPNKILRTLSFKCVEIIIDRCCIQEVSAVHDEETQSDTDAVLKSTDAADILLPGLLTIISSQLNLAAANNSVILSAPQKPLAFVLGVQAEWLLEPTITCDPTEPGFVLPHRFIPTSHTLGLWLWRPTGVKSGTLIVKAGPIAGSAAGAPWSSIVTHLVNGCIALTISDGNKLDGFSIVTTKPAATDGWTHFAYVIDAASGKVHLYLNGEAEATKDLPAVLYSRKAGNAVDAASTDLNGHPIYFGQAPSSATSLRAAKCALSRVAVVARPLDPVAISSMPADTAIRSSSSSFEDSLAGPEPDVPVQISPTEGIVSCPLESRTSKNCYAYIHTTVASFTLSIADIGLDPTGFSVGIAQESSISLLGVGERFQFGRTAVSYGLCFDGTNAIVRNSKSKKVDTLPRAVQSGDVVTAAIDIPRGIFELKVTGESLEYSKTFGMPGKPSDRLVFGVSMSPGQILALSDSLTSWDFGLTLLAPPKSLFPNGLFGRAETVGILGALCRITRLLYRQLDTSGIEKLLSHGVLEPVMQLGFSSNSTAVRMAASKALCGILPFAAPR